MKPRSLSRKNERSGRPAPRPGSAEALRPGERRKAGPYPYVMLVGPDLRAGRGLVLICQIEMHGPAGGWTLPAGAVRLAQEAALISL